ncbi:MAG: hypothetical protein RIQ52_237 [Pseudomonadota bacterium]|jgi:spermidine synthase
MTVRHGGQLVCCWRDSEGLLEVVDAYGVRSLHFGTAARQSAMCLREPDRVELSYVRAMLTSLAFMPLPRRILMIGLGGGSLAKALLQCCPEVRIRVVEYREQVLEIACQYFDLPQDERLEVVIADGRAHVMHDEADGGYDMLFVDAFSADGMAEFAEAPSFYARCLRLLAPGGVFAINLWGTQVAAYRLAMNLIRECFPAGSLRLPVPGKGNVIAFGLTEAAMRVSLAELQARCLHYQGRLGVELLQFLRIALRSLPGEFR